MIALIEQIITKERFKKIIIIFWTFWWFTAFWTDIVGAMAHLGVLQKSWAPDNNYPFLVNSLAMYHVPPWVAQFAFIGILAWSFLATAVFSWTCAGLHQASSCWMRRADLAFIVSLTLWLAFFIADQMVMKYDLEQNHMVQGGFQFLSYLMLYLLPSDEK